MSHQSQVCVDKHNWSGWSTVESVNRAGEKCFIYQRQCFACGLVDNEQGALKEDAT